MCCKLREITGRLTEVTCLRQSGKLGSGHCGRTVLVGGVADEAGGRPHEARGQQLDVARHRDRHLRASLPGGAGAGLRHAA